MKSVGVVLESVSVVELDLKESWSESELEVGIFVIVTEVRSCLKSMAGMLMVVTAGIAA